MTIKEIKKQLRLLRRQIKILKEEKSKAETREARRDLRNKIKGIKIKMAGLKAERANIEKELNNPIKAEIISNILKYETYKIFDRKYYNKFSITELEKHLEILRKKGGLK